MKLKNLVACVSGVLLLSTWQYHELYYIVPIKKIFSKGQTAIINDVPTWQYHKLYYIEPIKKIFSKGQTAIINDVPNACGNSSCFQCVSVWFNSHPKHLHSSCSQYNHSLTWEIMINIFSDTSFRFGNLGSHHQTHIKYLCWGFRLVAPPII